MTMTEAPKITRRSDLPDYAVLPDESGGYQIPEDPNRGPVVLLLALGVLVIFGLVVWNAYKQGVRDSDTAVLPKIVSDGAFKTTPDFEDEISGLDFRVLDEVSGDKRAETITPVEQPREGVVSLDGSQVSSDNNDLSTRQNENSSLTTTQTEEVIGSAGQAVDLLSGVKPPIESSTKDEDSIDKAETAPQEVSASLVERPIETPKAAPEVKKQPEYMPAVSSDGTFFVQLAAVKSETAIDPTWRKAVNKAPKIFGSVNKSVQTVDLGAKGVWHRIQAGRFDSRGEANTFCKAFKDRGGDCIVTERK
jgi:hypothetical protein